MVETARGDFRQDEYGVDLEGRRVFHRGAALAGTACGMCRDWEGCFVTAEGEDVR